MSAIEQNGNTFPADPVLILGVFGQADAALLLDWPVEPNQLEKLSSFRQPDDRYIIAPADQEERLNQLPSEKLIAFHQRARQLLEARLMSGDSRWEPVWDGVFNRLASRLYLDDSAEYRRLLAEVAGLPLETPLAQQRRAFFAAGVYLTTDEAEKAAEKFDLLLQRADLLPYIRARTLNARAVLSRIQGRPEAALNGYRESLHLWDALDHQQHKGMVLTNMGIVHYELRHYAKARELFSQAAHIFQEINNDHWLAVVHNEMGLVDRDMGHWQEALDHFDHFINQRESDGAGHHVGLGYLNQGEVFLFQGNIDQAEGAFQKALTLIDAPRYQIDINYYLGLVDLIRGDVAAAIQRFRSGLALAESADRREFMPHLYFQLGRVQASQGNIAAARKSLEAGVSIIEESRRPIDDDGVKISVLGRWQQLYEAIILLDLQEGNTETALLWTERARARAFAEQIVQKEALRAEQLTVESWKSELNSGEMIVSFFTTGVLESDLPLLRALSRHHPLKEILVVNSHTIRFVITKNSVEGKILDFNPNLLTSSSPRGLHPQHVLQRRVRQHIGRHLLGGLNYAGIETAFIVPHGPLHAVSFPSLPGEKAGPVLCYTPSLAIWHLLRIRPTKTIDPDDGLVVDFHGRDPERILQFAGIEAQNLIHLTGAAAWNGSIAELQKTAGRVSWLHFACHGWFDYQNPLDSYLEISRESNLTAAEVLDQWQLDAGLVVLSACQTGVSRVLRGDEPMGLVRAFLTAGAAAVVVSLWTVDDLATSILIDLFYQAIFDQDRRANPAHALAAAQTRLRSMRVSEVRQRLPILPPDWKEKADDDLPFTHPFYWAGLVLVGG